MKMVLAVFVGLVISTTVVSSGSCIRSPRNGIYLIPEGYIGEVIILYRQTNGITLEVEDGLYVYRIPPDGLLRVKNEGIPGVVDLRFFYVDRSGNRTEIKQLRVTGDRDIKGKPKNPFGGISDEEFENSVFVMAKGGFGVLAQEGKPFQYTGFIVSTPSESDKALKEYDDRLWNVLTDMQSNEVLETN